VVLAGEAGYFYNWSMGLVCAGWAAVQAGDMGEEAVSNIQRGLATMEKSGARLGLAVFTGLYADACLVLGLLPEGLAAVDRALAFAAQDGEKAYLPELHRIKAELLAGSGADRKRIAAELDAGNRIAEQQKASFYTHRITAAHSRLLAEESHS
jgi:predicted ATPase